MVTTMCARIPCGMTSGGCAYTDCPNNTFNRPNWQSPPVVTPLMPPQPMGCICPPTSEQTCGNPMCPRRAPAIGAR